MGLGEGHRYISNLEQTYQSWHWCQVLPVSLRSSWLAYLPHLKLLQPETVMFLPKFPFPIRSSDPDILPYPSTLLGLLTAAPGSPALSSSFPSLLSSRGSGLGLFGNSQMSLSLAMQSHISIINFLSQHPGGRGQISLVLCVYLERGMWGSGSIPSCVFRWTQSLHL